VSPGRREELIPTLFSQDSIKNVIFLDSDRDIRSFKSFPAIICNQKKSMMTSFLKNTFYCNLQGKSG